MLSEDRKEPDRETSKAAKLLCEWRGDPGEVAWMQGFSSHSGTSVAQRAFFEKKEGEGVLNCTSTYNSLTSIGDLHDVIRDPTSRPS